MDEVEGIRHLLPDFPVRSYAKNDLAGLIRLDRGTPYTQGDGAYPLYGPLSQVVSGYYSISPEQLHVNAGLGGVLSALFGNFCQKEGKAVLGFDPQFGYYNVLATQFRWNQRYVPWRDFDGFKDVARGFEGIILLNSPHNPTGECLDPTFIKEIVEAAPRSLVVLDAIYADFEADYNPLSPMAKLAWFLSYPNTLLLRGTKLFRMAGSRLGFAIGHSEVVERLTAVTMPFPVAESTAARAVDLLSSSDGLEGLARDLSQIIANRKRLIEEFLRTGREVGDSQATFIFSPRLEEFPGFTVRAVTSDTNSLSGVRIDVPFEKGVLESLISVL